MDIDEKLPCCLKAFLPPEFEVLAVLKRGWDSIENGAFLSLGQEEIAIFLSVDRGIPQQQNLSRFDLALVLLESRTTRLADLSPLIGAAVETMRSAKPK